MTVRGWTLGIDWSGHGNFTETQEDVTSRLDEQDLTVTIGRESQQTTGHSQSGVLSFGLQNSDRYLMPEYSGSPITGLVGPNKTVVFSGTAGTSIVNLLTGVLDSYQIDSGAVDYSFGATVLDGWGKPGARVLSTPLYTGIRTGAAVAVILDAIGWTGGRSIDPGASCLPYWWAEGIDAATAVNQLVDAEGLPAIAYVQGNTFYFRDRHHRIFNTRSTTSQATATHIMPEGTGPAGDLKIKAGTFVYDDGLKDIVNTVAFDVDLRTANSGRVVWSTDSPISLLSGETQVVVATASDPFYSATVTATMRSGTVDVALDRDNGAAVSITLAATSDAVIESLSITAIQVSVARTVKVTNSNASSAATYGAQNWPGGAPPFVNQYDAAAIASRLIAVYATRRPSLTFTVAGYTSALLSILLQMQVSDRITVRNDLYGVNADFIIERLVFSVKKLDLLELTIGCQVCDPAQSTNAIQFGVAAHGFNQGAFAVDGIDSATTVLRFDVAGHGFNQGVFGT